MKKYLQRIILPVVIMFYVPAACLCQVYVGSPGIPQDLEFHDASGNIIPIGDHSIINGSPLFDDNWGKGIINFTNGSVASDSLIGYSLYDDKLFFIQGGKIYLVNYPVEGFSIEFKDQTSNAKTYHFQSGYPQSGDHDKATLYLVIYKGKSITLLKWMHKKVQEPYNYGLGSQRSYIFQQEFYVFSPNENKIESLGDKVTMRTLRKKLPQFDKQIELYDSSHKFNPKDDDDLGNLFRFLDTGS